MAGPRSADRARTTRVAARVTIGALAVLASIVFAQISPATAAPIGTTHVTPDRGACGDHGGVRSVSCAAHLTERWMRRMGLGDVVRETVLVAPVGAGLWRSSTTGGICGFGAAGKLGLGLHHCDHRTFVYPSQDFMLLSDDVTTVTALAHESAHGVHERAGLDPVAITLSFDGHRLLPLELSADCWAGMALRWFVDEGMLAATARAGAQGLLRAAAGGLGHGSAQQRQSAFDAGYLQGATACNRLLGTPTFPAGP
ncbi:hypothetical protein [Gordonia rhizosphera]|uniref:Metalloprotease n=1 Tax=Gordonia rhizosphera NBRC 16068 TaxID=1108045 RepID=K6X560_9ACTN|nr:hypothetical protein [Gordonia rhizosphera]GAB93924.1 hypothetical protein GORHZ_247_00620 [Gordonia rhizosphera NBRC 16068]